MRFEEYFAASLLHVIAFEVFRTTNLLCLIASTNIHPLTYIKLIQNAFERIF